MAQSSKKKTSALTELLAIGAELDAEKYEKILSVKARQDELISAFTKLEALATATRPARRFARRPAARCCDSESLSLRRRVAFLFVPGRILNASLSFA